ncbi:MAG: substrate-binding domain-containing protein [Actinobacteria bacterium]|nr:substrate-binding domain-containing protein [Actinomycetota bacterium]
MTKWGIRALPVASLLALLISGCGLGKTNTAGDESSIVGQCKAEDCIRVPIAVSSEKIDLLTEMAKGFNATQTKVGDKRVAIDPKAKASGAGAQQLIEGWQASTDDPQPVIWTPAASSWGQIVDQRLAEKGSAPMAGQGTPFMNTPLTIAMPKPMAEALGYPGKAIGWADLFTLANDPQGWASFGRPEWGPFRLGKTNPNFSTSGLSALIAQNYAALGTTKDMNTEELNRPDVETFDRAVESAVVHYGDTTLTFLNNWYRADQRGNPYAYASAIAVEEKSVIDYNTGNPDGQLDPGEEPRKPRIPLVAIYPKEGTIFSDNPLYVLNASWVTPQQREAATKFVEFVQQPDNQTKVLQFNFRPGNPQVQIGAPIITANGVDPDQPQTLLQLPSPPVMVELLKRWEQTRKAARVMIVIDVSGSMGEAAGGGSTKLDLAQSAASDSLDQLRDDDQVGLRIFSTGLGPAQDGRFIDVVPIGPVGQNREILRSKIRSLVPQAGTPLYEVAGSSMQQMSDSYDPSRINAVVLLTDGKNEDGESKDDRQQLMDLVNTLQSQAKGELGKPVRLFTIGYGKDADVDTMQQLADAASGAYYNAGDPKTINKIFTQVISNF